MTNHTLTPEEAEEARRDQHRLEFAREWMKRKRQEQQEMIEEAKTDPKIIAAFQELDRKAKERGTRIIEL